MSRDCKGKEGEGRSSSLDKELAGPESGAYTPDVPIPPGPGGTVGGGAEEWEGDTVGVVNSVGRTERMRLRQLWAQTPDEPLPAV